MHAALAGEEVVVRYGGVEAVRGASLRVDPGELVALLGANGAGKTTLLLALGGHVRLDAGRVLMSGRAAAVAPHRRARAGLAFLGDDRHLVPTLTVRQSLRLVRGPEEEALRRFPALVPLLNRPAALLSGGEQQMLALARVLGTQPSVLLVDELSLGLAPAIRDTLLRLLRRLADDGLAVMVVEQNARSVLECADRALLMRRGELVDDRPARGWRGAPDDLAEAYLR